MSNIAWLIFTFANALVKTQKFKILSMCLRLMKEAKIQNLSNNYQLLEGSEISLTPHQIGLYVNFNWFLVEEELLRLMEAKMIDYKS